MKTEFQFRSTRFNTSEEKEYFLNPGTFGDDVVAWLRDELRQNGIATGDEPRQEDFGWYLNFVINGQEHCVVITFRPYDAAKGIKWVGWIEHQAGILKSILGFRQRDILPEAIAIVDRILTSSAEITDLSWEVHK